MATRSLEAFFRRTRLFLVVVFAWLLLVQGLHFAGRIRAHERLRTEVAERARAAAQAVLAELDPERLAESLRQWRRRGRTPSSLAASRRFLRDQNVTAVELLTPEGWGLDAELRGTGTARDARRPLTAAENRRLVIGEPIIDIESGLEGDPVYAVATVYQPVIADDASLAGVLQVDLAAENLARSRRELRLELALHGFSLLALVAALVLFGRWVLRPLRLLAATRPVPGAPAGAAIDVDDLATKDDTGFVVETYRRMVDELREKERELRRLREVERHRADELRELNASIVDSMVSGVLIVDLSGRIRSMNEVAREILGIDGRAMGRPWRDVLVGVPEIHSRIARCLEEGEVIRRDEVRLALPRVGRRDVGLTLSPLREAEGRRTGALCLVTDLTEVKRLQEQVRLKESLAELGELSGGIAHEFRNSLGTILGFARLVERAAPEGDAADHARAIRDEVAALRLVVDDFLRFANPTRLVLEPIDLRELIEELRDDAAARAGERRVRVRVEGDLPRLTGDETLLRRVFTNLLRNGVDAVGDPGEIVVTGEASPGEILVHVDDDGPGVADEDRERVFTPFFTKKDGGTGLGLPLARKVIVHHGGTLRVGASPLGGARFTVALPRR